MVYPLVLADPKFIAAHLIPDNDDRDNDKVYFFFTEKASEAGDREGAIHTRVGRVCAVRYFIALFYYYYYFTDETVNDDVSVQQTFNTFFFKSLVDHFSCCGSEIYKSLHVWLSKTGHNGFIGLSYYYDSFKPCCGKGEFSFRVIMYLRFPQRTLKVSLH